jgi:hypothetical protein
MRQAIFALALLLAGCGGQVAGPSSPTGSSNVSATRGQFRAEARPGNLVAGGNVHYTLTVTGPIRYEAGCAHTLTVWVVDSQNREVWTPLVPQFDCFAIMNKSLQPGETASLEVDWPTSPTLAAGRYTIHGLFLTVLPAGAGARVRENLPPLTIQITR